MARCRLCHKASRFIPEAIGVCLSCLRNSPEAGLEQARHAHEISRASYGLCAQPPKAQQGVECGRCINQCRLAPGQTSYCGLRIGKGQSISGASATCGNLSWYHDPLPTNCVADWVCPASTGVGYPRYARRPGPETGCVNLAVFFHACSFNCLYCQNWHFKRQDIASPNASVDDLIGAVDDKTSCICFFGGDPTPQLPFSIRAARTAIRKSNGKILRICWETNGSMHPRLADAIMDISLESGGCVKFDLKAFDDTLHQALTGVSNSRTLENFQRLGQKISKRPSPPPLVASTLLVPGYIDAKEIADIAGFIAGIDPAIPYSLLAFYPAFYMPDLPTTHRKLAEECLKAALGQGLENVRIGNIHLLR